MLECLICEHAANVKIPSVQSDSLQKKGEKLQNNALLSAWPAWRWGDRKVLCAVSGGADSVALLCALHEAAEPGQLIAAHYNHGWRGPESDADEAFVVQLCNRLEVPCMLGPATDSGQNSGENQIDYRLCVESAMLANSICNASESPVAREVRSEEQARQNRYCFLIHCAYSVGASYVATGHTADDRVETLLHNLFRGSGLAGAASMRMFRNLDEDLVLVRPFLEKRRTELIRFLQERHQTHREDSSNANEAYNRNFLRRRILPALSEKYPDVEAKLFHFSRHVESTLEDIERLATSWLESMDRVLKVDFVGQITWPTEHYWIAPVPGSEMVPWTIIREALRIVWQKRRWPLGEMDQNHWDRLRTAMMNPDYRPAAGSKIRVLMNLPGAIRVERSGELLAIGLPKPTRSV